MSACIVYIDSEHAKIFKLKEKKVEEMNLKKHEVMHHTHGDHDKAHKASNHFFHEVAGALKGMTEILLIGPGLAKTHLKAHIDEHHKAELSKHVVGVETVDKITPNQMLEVGRKFFKNYDQFNWSIG